MNSNVMITAFLSVFILSASFAGASNEYGLSDRPELDPARKSFYKGIRYMEKGRREFRRRPGKAQKMFEHAEDYFTKSAYRFRELGDSYDIDTVKQRETALEYDRRAHVWVNKARKRGTRGLGMRR
ncbi:MAG: hypothetical protein GF392_05155 [Candidatus Omnitrophica bacterium]|nr:hypothetical protein [Candidatus Omnitrophota bacterium]